MNRGNGCGTWDGRSGPALGLIETVSIARGMVVCDAMVKRSPVDILEAYSVTPGKFVVLVAGEVAEVEEAMDAGVEAASDQFLDKLYLPHPHPLLVAALGGTSHEETAALDVDDDPGALAILEFSTISATLTGADKSLKEAQVRLLEMKLARGIGGKGYFVLVGELDDIQASSEAAVACQEPSLCLMHEIIPRPHPDFLRKQRW